MAIERCVANTGSPNAEKGISTLSIWYPPYLKVLASAIRALVIPLAHRQRESC